MTVIVSYSVVSIGKVKRNYSMPKRNIYKLGALCAGYGGIELGLEKILKAETTWVSDFEQVPKKILERRFQGSDGLPIPNYGDLTLIENPVPVDIVTAGFPCQPVSISGKREGINDHRWLIEDVCRIAKESKAKWLILENVRGIFTANGGHALQRVWDALIKNGFTRFEWGLFRASDTLAPHQRERWFCLATNTFSEFLDHPNQIGPEDVALPDQHRYFAESEDWIKANGVIADSLDVIQWLEKTPNPDLFSEGTLNLLDKWPTDGSCSGTGLLLDQTHLRHGNNDTKGFRTLPTPTAREYKDAGPNVNFPRIASKRGLTGVIMHELCMNNAFSGWEKYGIAIQEWRNTLGRPAPHPLENKKFGYLSPKFVEWMMGLPENWVTGDDIGLHRTEALRALGNGVVPHQAAHAIETLHGRMMAQFCSLSPQEQKLRKILDLRQNGLSWKQVGKLSGYKSSSGPQAFMKKRIDKYSKRPDGSFVMRGN